MTTNQTERPASLKDFANEVQALVRTLDDEHELTSRIAERLAALLEADVELPEKKTRPNPHRYVMYPLHVAEDASFSIASAVWDVGQETPVHGHETWGVVGIHAGVEREVRYEKPKTVHEPLQALTTHNWAPGQVTVCCTTDDDVHQVSCGGDEPCVGIHVYGADIGNLPRRVYVPETGEVNWFVSEWASISQA